MRPTLWQATIGIILLVIPVMAKAACPPAPLSNGTTADATQVMAWLDCKTPFVLGSVNTMSTGRTNTVYDGHSPGGTGWNFIGSGGFWALRSDTNYNLNVDVYNTGVPLTALTVTQTGGVSFTNTISTMDVGKTDAVYNGFSLQHPGWNLVGSGGYWALRTATNNSFNLDVYNSGAPKPAVTVSQSGGMTVGLSLATFYAGRTDAVYNGSSLEGVGWNLIGSDGYWAMRTATNNSVNIDVYSSHMAAITILQNAYVGIGTASPGQKLDVAGTIRQSHCTTAGTLSVNSSGDLICTSDARLKNILGAYSSGLNVIGQLSPRRFTYKPTASDPIERFVHAGFIAQNVKEAIPEAVALQHSGYYSLDTTAILAASVNAIKELKAANDRQSAEVRSLHSALVSEARARSRQEQEIGALKASLLLIQQRLRTQTASN